MAVKASPERPVRIFLVTGEASGDQLAAGLVQPLREQFGGAVAFAGIGGPALARHGIASPIALSQLSVLGYLEGVMAWPRIARLARESARRADAFGADIVVLVDSWGFTLRVARALRRIRPQALLVKYAGPQVWASRPGRARTLARAVDHLLAIHPFDAGYYEGTGLPVTFVGNPALAHAVHGDGMRLRKRLGLKEDAKILLVLFGSRKSEFERLHRPFVDAVRQVRAHHPDLVVIAPLSAAIATQVRAAAAQDPDLQDMILLDEDQRDDAFAASCLALACSGTVTLQLAMHGVPMVVGYRLGALSGMLVKRFFLKSKYICLLNIAMEQEVVPEFVQETCRAGNLAHALQGLLEDETARAAQQRRLTVALAKMRSRDVPPPERAAQAIKAAWDQRIKTAQR